MIPAVRAIDNEESLLDLVEHLPGEASSALIEVATGKTIEAARRIAGLSQPNRPVDTADFDAALANNLTRRHIAEVDDDALCDILEAPMDQWRLFLHPSQERAVKVDAKGPVRVLGGAGTGKTIALVHRAVHLIRHVFAPHERILVTTFTRNLALELETAIRKLTTAEEFARIDVVNLHKVARDLLAGRDCHPEIASKAARREAWNEAMELAILDRETFTRAFYKEEWRQIIVPLDIRSVSQYQQANRKGRGAPLSKHDRAQLWPVFEAYRAALDTQGLIEWDDLITKARELVTQNPTLCRWRAVLSDEVQDYKFCELTFLRALVPADHNDMFLVGDSHQRIYGLPSSFRACGIHIVGRSYRLKVNYRTTERIRNLAVRVLEDEEWDDMDEGLDSLAGYHSVRLGANPTLHLYPTDEAELSGVLQHIYRWTLDGETPLEDICIAARFKRIVDDYQDCLARENIPAVVLDGDRAHDELGSAIRLATFHRLKGMEFRCLVLVSVQNGTVPWPGKDSEMADELAKSEHMKTERALFYVASTRARDELVVTGTGEVSPFLGGLV